MIKKILIFILLLIVIICKINFRYTSYKSRALIQNVANIATNIDGNIDRNIDRNIPNHVWLYWENKANTKTPKHIILCRESVIKNCSKTSNVTVLTESNIQNYLPNLRKDINNLSLPQKADYIRLYILKVYGGIYLDSDIILFKSPENLLNLLKYYDFVGFGSNSYLNQTNKNGSPFPSNWALVSRKNGLLVTKCLQEADKYLDNNNVINYHTLGRELLWSQIKILQDAINYKYFHFPSLNLERDLNGFKLTNKRFESDEKLDPNYDSYFTPLYNSAPGFSKRFTSLSKYELLNSNMLISQLFRKALL